jgi:hypothetical protein
MRTISLRELEQFQEVVTEFLSQQATNVLEKGNGLCYELAYFTSYARTDCNSYDIIRSMIPERAYQYGISPDGEYTDHRMFFLMFIREMSLEDLADMCGCNPKE